MSNKFQNSNLVIKNGVYLFFRLLLVLFLGFFATRLSLQVLGDEKFGIYNIVGGIIALFAIISLPIRDSIQRYLNVEFAKEQLQPGVVFCTAQRLMVSMIIVVSLLYESVGLYLINCVIQYPAAEKLAVNIIFQISVLTNIFGFASLPFVSLLFSQENMGVPAVCEIAGSIVKVVLIYCIQFVPINALIPYAVVFLIINVLSYWFYRLYCGKAYVECLEGKTVDRGLKKSMLSFSGWSLLEAVSGIALTYGSNVFINVFGGVLYNTVYGISKQLQNAVISFSSNVLKASDPQIISNTTNGNNRYRDQLVLTTSKISFLVTSFVWIVFHFDGCKLLTFWLSDVPNHTFEFCELAILGAVFSAISIPYRTTVLATGRIKGYFVSYGLLCLLSMVLMYVMLKLSYPIVTVMYIILFCSLISCLLSVYYSYKEAKISIRLAMKSTLHAASTIVCVFLVYLVAGLIADGWLRLFIGISLSSLALAVLTYTVVLDKSERSRVQIFIKTIINRQL